MAYTPITATVTLTAPLFMVDLGAILPPGVILQRIVTGFAQAPAPPYNVANIIVLGFAVSPSTGLLQAFSGQIQAPKPPALVPMLFLAGIPGEPYQDLTRVYINGIWQGAFMPTFAPSVIQPGPVPGSPPLRINP